MQILFKLRKVRYPEKSKEGLSTKIEIGKNSKVGVHEKMGNVESVSLCMGHSEGLKQNLLSDKDGHEVDYGAFVQAANHEQQKKKTDSDCTLPTVASQVSLSSVERSTRQNQTLLICIRDHLDEEIGDTSIAEVKTSSQHETVERIQNKENATTLESPTSLLSLPSGDALRTVPPQSQTPSNPLLYGVKRGSTRILNKASKAIAGVLGCLEDLLFPRTGVCHRHQNTCLPVTVRGGVMLYGCSTPEEHYECLKRLVLSARDLNSLEGLHQLGFEYRMVPCEQHMPPTERNDDNSVGPMVEELTRFDCDPESGGDGFFNHSTRPERLASNIGSNALVSSTMLRSASRLELVSQCTNVDYEDLSVACSTNFSDMHFLDNNIPVSDLTNIDNALCHCHACMRKLFHIESNIQIVEANRKQFIADGDMYEVVSRLVQEYAFDVMMEEGELQWLTIEDDPKHPIRALINSDHPVLSAGANQNPSVKNRPTLLICTGRGKVRAGIFSRQHLICDGMELSTCLPFVREAQARNMNVLIIDPNVIGEEHGFTVFQKTINHWCELCKQSGNDNVCRNTYILSHSASGGHLVRYLLDEGPRKEFLPFIQAIAFTDSTHNVQWARSPEQKDLSDMIQCERSVYFRCGKFLRDKAIDNQWYLHPAGQEVQTDEFWHHRFGRLKTMWAGTDEHSLINWFSFSKIWEHFDQFLCDFEKKA